MTTILKTVHINGQAPFSGKKVQMVLKPNITGKITFKFKHFLVTAEPSAIKLSPSAHSTTLFQNGIEIFGVEHLLSALYGLGINSLLIELKGDNQVPVLDSSAEYFTKILSDAGRRKIGPKRKIFKVTKSFTFLNKIDDSYAKFYPGKNFKLNVKIVFDNLIGKQQFSGVINPKTYQKEICWARTFIRSPINSGDPEKWDRIRKLIPILPKDPSSSPVIVFSDTNFITTLKKSDELVRHKVLDFLGDFSILGVDFQGIIEIYKPGHFFNHQLVQFLEKRNSNERMG